MCERGIDSLQEDDWEVESFLLLEIITLHPSHLTTEELIVRAEDVPSGVNRLAIIDALQTLKRAGVVRFTGHVVEPTFPALCAAALLSS